MYKKSKKKSNTSTKVKNKMLSWCSLKCFRMKSKSKPGAVASNLNFLSEIIIRVLISVLLRLCVCVTKSSETCWLTTRLCCRSVAMLAGGLSGVWGATLMDGHEIGFRHSCSPGNNPGNPRNSVKKINAPKHHNILLLIGFGETLQIRNWETNHWMCHSVCLSL